jgi:YggT family protein
MQKGRNDMGVLAQIVFLVASAVLGFITVVLLGRFVMQWGRVSFRNPVGHFVVATTDWVVLPLRRFVPGLFGLDMASLLPAWVAQMLLATLELVLLGAPASVLSGIPLFGLIDLARMAVYLIFAIVLIAAVLSWVGSQMPSAFSVFADLARPFLRPFRRLIPPLGGIDLSPLVLLLVLQIVLLLIARMRTGLVSLLLGGF